MTGERPRTTTGERSIIEREGFYRELVENAAEGFLTIDADGTIVFANRGVEQLLGHEPSALVGEQLLDIVPEALSERHRSGFRQYLDTGERQLDWDGLELTARHADGQEVPIRLRLREHAYQSQQLFTGLLQDRTRERESERRLRELAERSPGVLWLYRGPFAELLYVDSSYEDVWGQPIERIERDPAAFIEAIHPDDRDTAARAMNRLIDGEAVDMEFRIGPDGDHQRWAAVQAEPVVEDGEVSGSRGSRGTSPSARSAS